MSHHKQRRAIRKRLRARYGDNCCWCGKPMLFGVAGFDPANASIEHIVPKWQGGADDEANMMLAHLGCNHARNHEDTRRRAQAIEAQRAETAKQGSVHESAAPKGCAK